MREKILALIEHNSRLEVPEIAKLLGEDETAVGACIEEMQEEKIICGYHTLINWDNTGDEKVTALIEVKVIPQRGMGFDKIAERLYQYEEVDSVYLMSGAYDFMLMIRGRTMREVASFVSDKLAPLDPVQSTATHFILKKYKDHGTIFEELHEDERQMIMP